MPTAGRRSERAQVLLASALLIPILLGMAAIAVDIGSYADDKRNLQNAADAIALAAARDMCTPNPHDCSNTSAATTTADAYAAKNGIPVADMQLSFLGGSTSPKVRVTIAHQHEFTFIRVMGIGAKDVGASAGAVKVSPGGVPGAVPFGITLATLNASGYGRTVTIKYDASGGSTSGNFGAIDIDGTGNPPYESGLESGSPSMMCSVVMPSCSQTTCAAGGAFGTACSENAPSCDGPVCETETGNKISSTRTGVQYRLDHTSSSCDSFDEVFTPASAIAGVAVSHLYAVAWPGVAGPSLDVDPDVSMAKPPTRTPTPSRTPTRTPTITPTVTSTWTPAPTSTPNPAGTATPIPTSTATPLGGGTGKYTFTAGCNPWAGSGQCPAPSADTGQACSRRVIVVPIIDAFSDGKSPITVQGFALMYLNGFASGNNCTGSDCQISGVFVNADVSMNALSCSASGAATCVYDPDSSVHFERLVE